MRKTSYYRVGLTIFSCEYHLSGLRRDGLEVWQKVHGSERIVDDPEILKMFVRGVKSLYTFEKGGGNDVRDGQEVEPEAPT